MAGMFAEDVCRVFRHASSSLFVLLSLLSLAVCSTAMGSEIDAFISSPVETITADQDMMSKDRTESRVFCQTSIGMDNTSTREDTGRFCLDNNLAGRIIDDLVATEIIILLLAFTNNVVYSFEHSPSSTRFFSSHVICRSSAVLDCPLCHSCSFAPFLHQQWGRAMLPGTTATTNYCCWHLSHRSIQW